MVYWSDKAKDSVSAVALEGAKFRKVLVKHALKPTSLVVNPISGSVHNSKLSITYFKWIVGCSK